MSAFETTFNELNAVRIMYNDNDNKLVVLLRTKYRYLYLYT